MLSSEILNKAADLLEQYEWIQHYLARDPEGATVRPSDPTACAFCMVGAIWHVTDFNGWPKQQIDQKVQAAKDAVSRVLKLELNSNSALTTYNDDPRRTKQEVISALREAAQLEVAAGR